jgi:hypothetical protein
VKQHTFTVIDDPYAMAILRVMNDNVANPLPTNTILVLCCKRARHRHDPVMRVRYLRQLQRLKKTGYVVPVDDIGMKAQWLITQFGVTAATDGLARPANR